MDPFATLGISASYDIDLKAVERRHRELSRALHPDKYAAAGASERREALGRAVEVNEAWRIVRDSVRRAEALFQQAGIATGETSEPKPSPMFLMDMLEQREALADAKASRDKTQIDALTKDIESRKASAESALGDGFTKANGDRDVLAPLVPLLGELRFYRRFLEEVSAIEDEMENGNGAPRDL